MTDARYNDPMTQPAQDAGNSDLGFDRIDADRLSGNSMIKVDYERYAHFLDDSDASDEDKRAFVQTVWNIVFSIASLGFEAHPVQVLRQICGQSAFRAAAERKSTPQVID